jgi:hypothetical protein
MARLGDSFLRSFGAEGLAYVGEDVAKRVPGPTKMYLSG